MKRRLKNETNKIDNFMAVRRNLLNELNTVGLYTIIRIGEGKKQAPRKRGEGQAFTSAVFPTVPALDSISDSP